MTKCNKLVQIAYINMKRMKKIELFVVTLGGSTYNNNMKLKTNTKIRLNVY